MYQNFDPDTLNSNHGNLGIPTSYLSPSLVSCLCLHLPWLVITHISAASKSWRIGMVQAAPSFKLQCSFQISTNKQNSCRVTSDGKNCNVSPERLGDYL